MLDARDYTDHLISLKQYYPSPLVTCGEIVACRVKLNGGDDVGCSASLVNKLKGCWMRSNPPSVMSSTSPLSPKHWANRHPPEPDASESIMI